MVLLAGHTDLLRPDGRREAGLAAHDDPHRARGPVLCPLCLPIRAGEGLSA